MYDSKSRERNTFSVTIKDYILDQHWKQPKHLHQAQIITESCSMMTGRV